MAQVFSIPLIANKETSSESLSDMTQPFRVEKRLELGWKNGFLPLNHAEISKHWSIYIFNKLIFNKLKRNPCKGIQKEKSF